MHAFVLSPVLQRSVYAYRSTAFGRPVSFRVSTPTRRSVIPLCTPSFISACQQTIDDAAEEAKPVIDEQPSETVEKPTEVVVPAEVEPEAPQAVAEAEAPASEGASPEASKNGAGGEKKRRRRTRTKREVTLPLEDLKEGMELEGFVRGVMDYGAFIGGLGTPSDGLVHVSQLAEGYVENVADVVKAGDKVKVRVLSVDLEKKTFALSLKSAEQIDKEKQQRQEREDMLEQRNQNRKINEQRRMESQKKWETFTYDPDVFLNSKIISLTDFGAFVQILNDDNSPSEDVPTDGLIHISELSTARVEKVSDVVKEGDLIKARILNTDPDRNRISMSMKPVPTQEELEQKAEQGNAFKFGDSGTGKGPQGSSRSNKRSRDRKESSPDDSFNISTDVDSDEANQPQFKTTFQLAFEKANIPVPEPVAE